MKSYTRRLERLEAPNRQPFPDVLALVAAGCRYADLTDNQRERYAEYWGVARDALEEVETAVVGSLDFPLERKEPQELKTVIADLEDQILNRKG